jgi:hypothetical protein
MAMNEPSPDSAADTVTDAATPAPPASILDHRLPARAGLAVLAALVAFPFVAVPLGAEFYVSLVTRILAFAIAATSLNLILGFGGMVSFGHAAFVGPRSSPGRPPSAPPRSLPSSSARSASGRTASTSS